MSYSPPHPLSASYKVGTELEAGGVIAQTTIDLAGEVRQRFLDTQDAQVRAALIAMGWMPPDRRKGTIADDLREYGVAYEVDENRVHPSRVVVRWR